MLNDRFLALIAQPKAQPDEDLSRILTDLADHKTPDARNVLKRLLDHHGQRSPRIAAFLLAALVRHGTSKSVDQAIRYAERSRNAQLTSLLHRVFGAATRTDAQHHIRTHVLKSSTPQVREEAIRAMGIAGDKASVAPLMHVVMSKAAREIRAAALEALGTIGDGRARALIEAHLTRDDEGMRMTAALALGSLGGTRSLSSLRKALSDKHPRVREEAARALGVLKDEDSVPLLIEALRSSLNSDLRLMWGFVEALQAISGARIGADVELWKAWHDARKGRPKNDVTRDPKPPTVESTYYGIGLRSDRIIFVLDVSSSMAWNKRIETAKKELTQVVDKLRDRTRFNLITFSDGVRNWHDTMRKATSGARAKAKRFARYHKPEGGTNTMAALSAAMADPEADTIFFLSDGQPSVGAVIDPTLILLEIARRNRFRRVRIHCIALLRGDPPHAFAGLENRDSATNFMRRLAKENGGEFKLIEK